MSDSMQNGYSYNKQTYQQSIQLSKDPRPLKHFRPPLRTDSRFLLESVAMNSPTCKSDETNPVQQTNGIDSMSDSSSKSKAFLKKPQHELKLKNMLPEHNIRRRYVGSGRTLHSQESTLDQEALKLLGEHDELPLANGQESQNWRLKLYGMGNGDVNGGV